MKRIFLSIVMMLAVAAGANAVPAYPHPIVITQPDGTELTIIGHGDEFLNYITTVDGYTIMKAKDGFYHYADLQNGQLMATKMIARDQKNRSVMDEAFLTTIEKNLMPEPTATQQKMLENQKSMWAEPNIKGVKRNMGTSNRDYKGLVILVEFQDRKFRLGENTQPVFDDMMNKEGFRGFTDPEFGYQTYTGSVRDYFNDNSNGLFNTEFEVVGPVCLDMNSTDMGGFSGGDTAAEKALRAVDGEVNFKDFDSDNDGYVDMFYIIYAGYGSNYGGNNENYVWPYASGLDWKRIRLDGVYASRYACSVELYGWENSGDRYIDGIGTIIHEFSHVLGYADHYDTGYTDQVHPGGWDIMSGGSYNNRGRTPVGYNAYERYAGGFMDLDLITEEGDYTLGALTTTNTAYRINTPQRTEDGNIGEYFTLEYRKKTGWDAELPAEGMLVMKIDSTDMNLWWSNRVNATEHSCVKLLRAKDNGRDNYVPFPGSGNVKVLNNESATNLLSYRGKRCRYVLSEIKRRGDMLFTVSKDQEPTPELPEGTVFYESFNENDGESGLTDFVTIGTETLVADNDGWEGDYMFGGYRCMVMGKGSGTTDETVKTPVFTLEEGAEYEFSFKAAPWTNPRSFSIKVSVAEGNAEVDTEEIPLEKEMYNDCKVKVTGSGEVRLALSRRRAVFIDDVMLVMTSEPSGIDNVTLDNSSLTGKTFNLSGQQVQSDYKGIVIENGKKIVR